jgi:CheY-like chemotaxis protein
MMGERLRVLIVKDNQDEADSLGMLLRVLGYEASVAYTGPEGITAAHAFVPDVLVCDLGLAGCSGWEGPAGSGPTRRLPQPGWWP